MVIKYNQMIKKQPQGLIRMIILIIIAIAVLSWYGVDIKNFFSSELVQKNFSYIWNLIKDIWNNFLVTPAIYLWGIWVDYVWTPFIAILQKSK